MIGCKCVIHYSSELRFQLLRLLGEIIQTIDQNNTIKPIQSAIQSEQSKQCKQQYGQSKTIQANQNKPGDNNNYIIASTYAKTEDLSISLMFKKLM